MGKWWQVRLLLGFCLVYGTYRGFSWVSRSNMGAIASESVVLVRAMDLWRPWARSHGSGFVWDHDGHIVTNSHVVQMSSLLAVHFADGGSCRAQVVATSDRCDVALLKLKSTSCSGASGSIFQLPKPLPLSNSLPRLGEEVMAVGHPGNWAWLVGVGSVTGVGRQSSRAVQKWLALQDFQRRCAVNGMVFASVPAGPGSSGGPLINQRGEVVGITTWQFRSTPLLTAAVSTTTLQLILPQLRDIHGAKAPSIGIEEHLGSAKLIWPRPSNAALGVSMGGARLWWPPWRISGLWWLDEIVQVENSPVYSVADVLEAVQQAPLGSHLDLELRRFGMKRTVTAEVKCAPSPKRLRRKLLRFTIRALATAQMVLGARDFAQTLRKDAKAVVSTLQEMKTCNFFNQSHRDDNIKQMSLATFRFLVKADALKNLCFPSRPSSKCVVPEGAKIKTWKKVKVFDLCRLRCNAQSVDTSFCCMHRKSKSTCHMVWGSNSTIAASASDGSTSTICRPMPVLDIIREMRILLALTLSVLRDWWQENSSDEDLCTSPTKLWRSRLWRLRESDLQVGCDLHGHGARLGHHAAAKIVTVSFRQRWTRRMAGPIFRWLKRACLVVSPWRKWLSPKSFPYSKCLLQLESSSGCVIFLWDIFKHLPGFFWFCPIAPIACTRPGDEVIIRGLAKAPELNGKKACDYKMWCDVGVGGCMSLHVIVLSEFFHCWKIFLFRSEDSEFVFGC